MKVPGIIAAHAIITPHCRTVPRSLLHPDPALAAYDEAVMRLREEYELIVGARSDGFIAHVVLTIEAPALSTETDDG